MPLDYPGFESASVIAAEWDAAAEPSEDLVLSRVMRRLANRRWQRLPLRERAIQTAKAREAAKGKSGRKPMTAEQKALSKARRVLLARTDAHYEVTEARSLKKRVDQHRRPNLKTTKGLESISAGVTPVFMASELLPAYTQENSNIGIEDRGSRIAERPEPRDSSRGTPPTPEPPVGKDPLPTQPLPPTEPAPAWLPLLETFAALEHEANDELMSALSGHQPPAKFASWYLNPKIRRALAVFLDTNYPRAC